MSSPRLRDAPSSVAPARSLWHRLTGWHVHRFRWAGDDMFSGSSHYACRCGVVRPGL